MRIQVFPLDILTGNSHRKGRNSTGTDRKWENFVLRRTDFVAYRPKSVRNSGGNHCSHQRGKAATNCIQQSAIPFCFYILQLGLQVTSVLKQLASQSPKKIMIMSVVEGSKNRRYVGNHIYTTFATVICSSFLFHTDKYCGQPPSLHT